MAVYTSLLLEEIRPLLKAYSLDNAVSLEDIASGVENSNFLLTTQDSRYILTLYEKRVNSADLPYFLGLLNHLAAKGFPCPRPISAANGELLYEIKGKPAAMVSFLEGTALKAPRAQHIHELGKTLAQMHLAAHDFPMSRANNCSLDYWLALFDSIKARGDTAKQGLVAEIEGHLQFLQNKWPTNLPNGVIHADLFPDNVFFKNNLLSGVIDFYFACNDFFMYDLAICMNAWCFEANSEFNITKAKQLLKGYHSVRPITTEELIALPLLAQGAAMRFLLTRLYDWLHTVDGALVKLKDPLEYLRKLRFHQGITHPSSYGFEIEAYD